MWGKKLRATAVKDSGAVIRSKAFPALGGPLSWQRRLLISQRPAASRLCGRPRNGAVRHEILVVAKLWITGIAA